jgi:hypothetical protein
MFVPYTMVKRASGSSTFTQLEVFYKTNDVYHINEWSYPIKYTNIMIKNYDIDYKMWVECTCPRCRTHTRIIHHLTFDMVWRFLKPTDRMYFDVQCNGDRGKYRIRYRITRYDIREITINSQRISRIILQIRAKLLETETAFRQKLLCCGLTDCKIDFF